MTDAQTLRTYAEKAADYADLTRSDASDQPAFAAFLSEIPAGGHVLDLGCGPGHFSAELAKAGLVVTATDAVPEMVALAARHNGVTAHCMTFDEISGSALYDGVWANFSLLHAPRDAMPIHLKALHRTLKPGGLIHIALKSGEGSIRDTINRLYTYYTRRELTDLLGSAGFTITANFGGTGVGLDGVSADWIAVQARA